MITNPWNVHITQYRHSVVTIYLQHKDPGPYIGPWYHEPAQGIAFANGLAELIAYNYDMKGAALNKLEAERSAQNYRWTFKPWENAVQKLQSAGIDYLPSRPHIGETRKHLMHRLLCTERALLLLKRQGRLEETLTSRGPSTAIENWIIQLGKRHGSSNQETKS